MSSISLPAPRRRPPARFFGVARRGQTYRNLLYVLLALPLGLVYYLAFTAAASLLLSIGLDFIGLLILLVIVVPVGAWQFASMERVVAQALLRVEIAPMAPSLASDLSSWERIKAHVRNPVAWKSLVFLILRVPVGFVSLALMATIWLLSLLALAMPVAYLIATHLDVTDWLQTYVPLNNGQITLHDWIAQSSLSSFITGEVQPGPLASTISIALLGALMLILSLYVANWLAAGWGWFARQMLGLTVRDLQLAEARAVAARERSRAEQADRSRRELILNASHELRTPVASLRAHLESLVMLEGDQLPESVRRYLGVTLHEAERLGTLVDELLMLARADSDELRVHIEPFSAAEVVEEVFQAMEALALREREVTLVRSVQSDLPPVLADRDRLAQVVMNLVRNAITYTPSGGIVSISLIAGEPGTLSLTVTDTGTGIPEEDLPHVFERFYRADASRTRATGGFGLGLSIVRDLVQAMGGTVVAERSAEGGTRIRVTLRAASVAAADTAGR
jgi:signal transduction histidine kinase